jgi:hypothetical protein
VAETHGDGGDNDVKIVRCWHKFCFATHPGLLRWKKNRTLTVCTPKVLERKNMNSEVLPIKPLICSKL